MSNWVGGLPPDAKTKEEKKKKEYKAKKKAAKAASLPDGDHPKAFFGGAIPPVPSKPPGKYQKEPPLQVKLTGAGAPIQQEAPSEPKAPLLSLAATQKGAPSPPKPPPPSPPKLPPPSPEPEATPPQSYAPPPPSPQSASDTSPSPPQRYPLVFDKKPQKKKRKKSKKKPKAPPPPKPVECDDDVCGDQGDESLGGSNPASIFAICYIPATRQGEEGDEEDDSPRSGFTSPRSEVEEVDDGPDIPLEVPSYKRTETFSGVFGKKIDARNLAELGPHGWHKSAGAPDHIAETITQLGKHGWHRSIPDEITGIATDGPSEWDEWSGWHEPRNSGDHEQHCASNPILPEARRCSIAREAQPEFQLQSAAPDVPKHHRAWECGLM